MNGYPAFIILRSKRDLWDVNTNIVKYTRPPTQITQAGSEAQFPAVTSCATRLKRSSVRILVAVHGLYGCAVRDGTTPTPSPKSSASEVSATEDAGG